MYVCRPLHFGHIRMDIDNPGHPALPVLRRDAWRCQRDCRLMYTTATTSQRLETQQLNNPYSFDMVSISYLKLAIPPHLVR
jgi:hypothetical protein